MPQLIRCPDCGRTLRVPDDLLGKKVKCPGCGVKFVGAADDAPEELDEAPARASFSSNRADSSAGRRVTRRDDDEEDDRRRSRRDDEEDDRPRRSRRRRDDDDYEDEDDDDRYRRRRPEGDPVQGWQRVRLGINLVITGEFIWIAAIVLLVLGGVALWAFGVASIFSMASSPPSSATTSQAAGTFFGMAVGAVILFGLFWLLNVAEQGLRVAGEGFCMGVVPTRRATYLRGLAIATFICGAAGVLLFYGGYCGGYGFNIGAFSGYGYGYPGYWGVGPSVIGLSSMVFLGERYCFLFFLRGVAVSMRQEALARQIVYFMIAAPCVAVLWVVSWVVLFCAGAGAVVSSGTGMFGGSTQSQTSAAANTAGMAMGWVVALFTCWGVGLLVGLALFIWYLVILFQTRSVVSGWLYDRE
jgi:hypothetical protein